MSVETPSALIIIDFQKAIDDPSWGHRNNPNAEDNIARLLSHWRLKNWPIFHIRHDSTDPNSTYRPHQPGHAFKLTGQPQQGETVIGKTTNSAFIGTDFEARLRSASLQNLVMAGVITNNSVEATVRHAGNLGFNVYLIEDACFTFNCRDWQGVMRTADEVHAMSLANLHGEYCTVIKTANATEQEPAQSA